MKLYLSGKRVLLFLLCSAFAYTFFSISGIPWSAYVLSLELCAVLLSVYLLSNLDIIFMKRYRFVNLLSLVYSISALISVYFNGQMSLYSLLLFILRLAVLPFIEVQREKGHVLFFCKVMMFWLAVFLAANDILMVIMPGRFYGDGISKTFLMGNKFQASYDHIIMLLMICLVYGKKPAIRRYLPLLFAAVILICHYMDCNTATMGTAVFLLIAYAPESVWTILNRRKIVLAVIAGCALFIFFGSIVQLPPVKYFIKESLGRDVTLTGRKQIYQILPKIIRAHPWIGYGSSAEVMSRYTGAFNAQNGFFDLVVQNGFPSALLYVFMLTALIRKGATKDTGYLLGAVYGYFFMSTVEMTFGTALMLFGILLYTDTADYLENPVSIVGWER